MEKASVTMKSFGVTSGAYIYSMYEHSSQRFADMKSYVPSVNMNMKSYVPTIRYPPMGQLANRMRMGMGNMFIQLREFRGYCGSTDLTNTPSLIDIELDTNTGNAISRTYIIEQLDRQKQQQKHLLMLNEIKNINRNCIIGPVNKTFIPNAEDARKEIAYTDENRYPSSPTSSHASSRKFMKMNSNEDEPTEKSPFIVASQYNEHNNPSTSTSALFSGSLMSPNKRPNFLQLSSLVEEKDPLLCSNRTDSSIVQCNDSKLTNELNNSINRSSNNKFDSNKDYSEDDYDDDDDNIDEDNINNNKKV